MAHKEVITVKSRILHFCGGATKSDIKLANDVKSGKIVHVGIWRGPRKKVSENCGKYERREHKIVVFMVTGLQPQHWEWHENIYTGRHRRNGPNFGRVFLMLNYTDITQNTYIQSWTVTEIMAIEKFGLLRCPRTVSCPWRHIHPLRKPGNKKPLSNIGMQWRWRDNSQLLPASITWKPKANAKVVRVFL